MTFVNERIPEEDKKKHNITGSNFFYRAGSSDWVVDRERDMFLVLRASHGGAEGMSPEHNWAFYWRGHLLDVLLRSFPVSWDESTGQVKARKRVLQLNRLTPELEAKRAQIIGDLQEALTANRAFGLVPESMSYELTVDAE